MLHIGCHLSIAKGYAAMGATACSIGADTFAFFTRNPRGGSVRAIDEADVARLRAALIDALRDRPEGFVADGALVPGRPISPLLPFVEV